MIQKISNFKFIVLVFSLYACSTNSDEGIIHDSVKEVEKNETEYLNMELRDFTGLTGVLDSNFVIDWGEDIEYDE